MKSVLLLLGLPAMTLLSACASGGHREVGSIAPENISAEMVKAEFRHAWSGYRRYAWGHDALKPITKSYRDWYDTSLLMTPVDALDTMILMGLNQEADETRAYIDQHLSFDQDVSVSVFEITIRLLGGLLSSYELSHDEKLLALAKDLGNRLLPAFRSPTGMPYARVNLHTGAVSGVSSNPAEIGSLMLEFGTLSALTGDPKYYRAAKHAVQELHGRSSRIGLVGSGINIETGVWTAKTASIGDSIDSYYEYLYKSWLLFGDPDFKKWWEESISGINRYVAEEVNGNLWYGRVEMDSGHRISSEYGALDAFFAGLLALSGDLERARRLQKSNESMWRRFGLEPERFDYKTWEVRNAAYHLRPEIIESAFYLHALTGSPEYVEMGKRFFADIVRYGRTADGYAEIRDVRTKEKTDATDSFFLAETLKYSYLLLSPEKKIDLSKKVFNTEAHPLDVIPPSRLPAGI